MLSNTQTYGINQSLVYIPTKLFWTKKSEKEWGTEEGSEGKFS